MNVIIKKATIRGSLFLNYEFEQTDGDVKNLIRTSSDAPIHDDLRNAFRDLIPHFAIICEEVTDEKLVKKAVKNPEQYLYDRETAADETFFKYRVYEFSLTEKKGIEFITLSGSKYLTNHQDIGFTTPPIDLDSKDYKLSNELSESIDHLRQEVLNYMNGKQAPKTQLEMFGDTDSDSDGAFNQD